MEYVFDGSFAGYLTGLFECVERREWDAVPVAATQVQQSLFGDSRCITTDLTKAKRVNDGLVKRLSAKVANDFFCCFLSEAPNAWQTGYKLMHRIFKGEPDVLKNFGDADVLYFARTLKKVSRERHRMMAFVRFSKSADGLFFALVEPDFNVLPLIAAFFKNRYADQHWLLYDTKRQYGLLYDQTAVTEVQLSAADVETPGGGAVSLPLDKRDELFKRLWRHYFKSTNIMARRNIKLHLKHVPKRYWKYLVEKNETLPQSPP